MAKKRRKEKEIARLRREVEVLRAQLPSERAAPAEPQKEKAVVEEPKKEKEAAKPKAQATIRSVDPKYIKADLTKSAALTIIAISVIIALTIIF